MTVTTRRAAPILAALAALAAPAHAQVAPTPSLSASTVTLPDGPGSVAGLATPAELDLFSAQVEYSLPIRVPTAGGLSPSVALTYSGALGNGPLGIGWTLAAPAIRRSLREGVPRYDASDELTIEGIGGGRLVPFRGDQYVVEGAGRTFRVQRIRDGFEVVDGDGTRYRFGHTAAGRIQDGSRVAVWLLQSVVNLAGETMAFEYRLDRGQAYLSRVVWGPGGRYRLETVLGSRADVVTSFATGFEVTTALRVERVRSVVALPGETPVELAGYELRYDDTGAVSRLTRVTMTGRKNAQGAPLDDATVPPVRFGYAEPDRPRQWSLDSDGWVLDQRGVALVDVDGDGADDLLRLEPGYAAWRKNLGGRFAAAQVFDRASGLELAGARFLDVDGDARAEIVRIVDDTWRAYRIEQVGAGFALGAGRVVDGTRGVSLGGGATVLTDIDGDGRTDVLDGVTGGVRLRTATASGLGPAIFLPPIAAASLNVEPGAANVRFLDVNGDALADAVWITDTWMKVYLGRGNGTFHPYAKVFYPWGTAAIDVDQLHLVDLDRDGVVDLLRVDAGKLRWFRGLAGLRFDAVPRQLARPDGAALDARVTFADVDGNGSQEVVWATLSAMWALDLAGGTTRAMVASIDDGMGEVTTIAYGTSTQLSLEAAAAGQPWQRLLPRSMAVPVRQETAYADGTPSRVVTLGVRDGFWDSAERRFGGFLVGRSVLPGDTAAQVRVEQSSFLEGTGSDRVLRGKPREARVEDGLGTLYTVTTSEWAALLPASVEGADDPSQPLLRRAVLRRQESSHSEGVATPIRTLVETRYDAEARPFEEHQHGRLDLTGDEKITWKRYASDDVTWVRDRVVEEALYDGDRRLVARTRHYFGNHQGDPLPLEQIGFGWPRRNEGYLWQDGNRPTSRRWVQLSATGYDAHGNVVRSTEGPDGVGTTRTFGYDADGLFAERESVEPVSGRILTWTAGWDRVLGVSTSVTEPAGNTTYAEYDSLGRVVAKRQNALAAHQRYVYEWTAPRPRTYSYAFDGEERTLAAAANDWSKTDKYRGWRHTVTVADSTGQELYTAGRLGASQWLISGWKRKDGRGRVTEVLEGFTHHAAALPSAPPTDRPLRKQRIAYDAVDRAFEHTLPTGARTRRTYRAFEETVAADGLAPVTSRFDGQGRILRTSRTIDSDLGATTVESVDATYDAGGRIVALELQRPDGAAPGAPCAPGQAWITHCFTYDSFGRLVEADDPDIGLRELTYDDAGHLTRHVNGAGQGITLSYDRAGRLTRRRADDGTQFEYFYDVAVDGRTPVPGHLGWVREPTGRVDFAYDQFGRANHMLRNVGSARVFHDPSYAPSGVLRGHRYVRDWSLGYVRDMAGRVVKAIGQHSNRQDVLWEATGYDDAGRVTGERFGNGVTGVYGYDGNGQTEHVAVRRGTTALYDVSVTRNAFGAITDAVDHDGAGLDHTAQFGYDVAGRLTSALFGSAPASGAPDGRFAFQYGYDASQNMVSRQAQGPRALGQYLGVHCYGQDGAGPRQLTSVVAGTVSPGGSSPCDSGTRVASFRYDDAGRQLTDGDTRMTYDGLDQLVAVELPGGIRVEYGYGYDGQRLRTTDNQGSTPEHWITPELREIGGAIEQYVTVGDRIVAKVNLTYLDETTTIAAGVRGARTVALALLAPLALLVAGLGALTSARARRFRPALAAMLVIAVTLPGCGTLFGSSDDTLWHATRTTYFHAGFGAGPVLLTGDAGRVVDERRYEPFGQAIDSYRETDGRRDGVDYALEPFNGLNKPSDPRTSWSYHGARWMAPQTGRWLTPDPPVKAPDPEFMDAPWRLHPYQYGDQSPTLYWDDDGNQPTPVAGPWSPGGQPIPCYIGNEAHREIAQAYIDAHPGDEIYVNCVPIYTILDRMGVDPKDLPMLTQDLGMMPDIFNATTGEVYEIKPKGLLPLAMAEADMYVTALRAGGADARLGTPGAPGTVGVLPAPGGVIEVESPFPGTIVYSRYNASPVRQRQPQLQEATKPVPVPTQQNQYAQQNASMTAMVLAALGGALLGLVMN
jgi:RHS repeat-associated protein